jgi:hypothetical protein
MPSNHALMSVVLVGHMLDRKDKSYFYQIHRWLFGDSGIMVLFMIVMWGLNVPGVRYELQYHTSTQILTGWVIGFVIAMGDVIPIPEGNVKLLVYNAISGVVWMALNSILKGDIPGMLENNWMAYGSLLVVYATVGIYYIRLYFSKKGYVRLNLPNKGNLHLGKLAMYTAVTVAVLFISWTSVRLGLDDRVKIQGDLPLGLDKKIIYTTKESFHQLLQDGPDDGPKYQYCGSSAYTHGTYDKANGNIRYTTAYLGSIDNGKLCKVTKDLDVWSGKKPLIWWECVPPFLLIGYGLLANQKVVQNGVFMILTLFGRYVYYKQSDAADLAGVDNSDHVVFVTFLVWLYMYMSLTVFYHVKKQLLWVLIVATVFPLVSITAVFCPSLYFTSQVWHTEAEIMGGWRDAAFFVIALSVISFVYDVRRDVGTDVVSVLLKREKLQNTRQVRIDF